MAKSRTNSSDMVTLEYGQNFTILFLIAMFIILPFFMTDGYGHIGDDKYNCFKVLTLLYVVPVTFVYGITLYFLHQKGKLKEYFKSIPSPMKVLMFFWVSNIITFIFSLNHKTAWVGYSDWHLGLFTWSMMILSAFYVSTFYTYEPIVWIAAILGSGVAGLLAVLNRFGVYPVDVVYHVEAYISTLGNTNWYTGYHLCFLGLSVALYISYNKEELFEKMFPKSAQKKSEGFRKGFEAAIHAVLLIYNVIMIAAAFVCGSDTAILGLVFIFFVGLGISVHDKNCSYRYLHLVMALGAVMEAVNLFCYGILADKYIPYSDKLVKSIVSRHIGLGVLCAGIIAYVLMRLIHRDEKREWNKTAATIVFRSLVALMVAGTVIVIILMGLVTANPDGMGALGKISQLRFDNSWGSSRGRIWRGVIESFAELKFPRKYIGVGQGVLSEYMYSIESVADSMNERYGNSGQIVMVAHNEYLNLLVENGIIGMTLYVFFMAGSFFHFLSKRHENKIGSIAILVMAGYFPCSMVLFSQVTATPYLLIFIAMSMAMDLENKWFQA